VSCPKGITIVVRLSVYLSVYLSVCASVPPFVCSMPAQRETSYSVFAFLLKDLLRTKYITFTRCCGLIWQLINTELDHSEPPVKHRRSGDCRERETTENKP